MIDEEKRKAIQVLYGEGKKKKQIARLLNLSAKTVRAILAQDSESTAQPRCDKKEIDPEVLRRLYARCDGYVQRVHEILAEEEGIEIGYSTLTRLIRELGIGQKTSTRCHQVEDVPGTEMQHDTTPCKLTIGDKDMALILSGLYLRYCKMRYIKFYRYFNRFKMKCFFYEALRFLGYGAKMCVIDNTNLAVLRGTGACAVFHPEMVAFAKPYGFEWLAHEKGHANRKAGTERSFWTVQTNFLPGRTFKSIEDLNRQAFEWATSQYARRPMSRTRLIPVDLFEEEKPDLIKLPDYMEPPYLSHQRDIDQYGYVAFDANYYWIPGKLRGRASVIEYPDRVKIFAPNQPPIEYPLPAFGVRNEKFSPRGVITNPYEPRHLRKPCHEEERYLRALDSQIGEYLDFVKSKDSDVKQKTRFIRDLYVFSKNTAPGLFLAVISRALKYRLADIERLKRISFQLMQKDLYQIPEIAIESDYERRAAYQEGRFSRESEYTFYPQPDRDEIEDDRE
jgi:transposase